MVDYKRAVISRWRLSNHKLRIELGRYTRPPTPREERTYTNCGVLEDEYPCSSSMSSFQSYSVKI